MNEHAYKVIELVGSSKTTIEDAVKNALSKASESLNSLRWFEVTQIRGGIEGDGIAYWQVGLKFGITMESRQEEGDSKGTGEKVKSSAGPNPSQGSGKYRCKVCGYIYDPGKGDPDNGIKPGTLFRDLPDEWKCPECGVNKDQFEEI